MQVVKKFFIVLFVLWFALLLFMPKKELFYTLEKELKGVKIPDIVISPAPAAVETGEVITISEEDIEVPSILKKSREEKKEEAGKPAEQSVQDNISSIAPEENVEKVSEDHPSKDTQTGYKETFDTLVKRIYDRDFDLGSCFERNIHFESFENSALTWVSEADGEEKKMLITHWAVIKMFVQDLFGIETRIINIPRKAPANPEDDKKKIDLNDENSSVSSCDTESGSMIEAVEMKSSCIMPEAGEVEAAKEKEPSNILEEPMIKELLNLFEPKKVRVKKKV